MKHEIGARVFVIPLVKCGTVQNAIRDEYNNKHDLLKITLDNHLIHIDVEILAQHVCTIQEIPNHI